MEENMLANIEKLLPAVNSVGEKLGYYLGEALNNAIDKVFDACCQENLGH